MHPCLSYWLERKENAPQGKKRKPLGTVPWEVQTVAACLQRREGCPKRIKYQNSKCSSDDIGCKRTETWWRVTSWFPGASMSLFSTLWIYSVSHLVCLRVPLGLARGWLQAVLGGNVVVGMDPAPRPPQEKPVLSALSYLSDTIFHSK